MLCSHLANITGPRILEELLLAKPAKLQDKLQREKPREKYVESVQVQGQVGVHSRVPACHCNCVQKNDEHDHILKPGGFAIPFLLSRTLRPEWQMLETRAIRSLSFPNNIICEVYVSARLCIVDNSALFRDFCDEKKRYAAPVTMACKEMSASWKDFEFPDRAPRFRLLAWRFRIRGRIYVFTHSSCCFLTFSPFLMKNLKNACMGMGSATYEQRCGSEMLDCSTQY